MTPGFQNAFVYTKSADGRNFVLVEPLVYVTAAGEIITAPPGTTTDGASTPRILWRVIPPFGPYWPAAVLHDYLYRSSQKPKAECDSILLEAMLWLGVEQVEADAIYEGVKLGGQSSFDSDRAAQAAA